VAAKQRHKVIIVDIEDVVNVREGALAMLLSVMKEIDNSKSRHKARIVGSVPKDEGANSVLESSGFYEFVTRHGRQHTPKGKNIMRRGVARTAPHFLGNEVRKSMETIWGAPGRNPVLRNMIFEMMRNSCDHAFVEEDETQWHLAISHDIQNKVVKFSFVDNGRGIIQSLKSDTPFKKIINFFSGNDDILETAFRNGIESRTGFKWRGKGLPSIFEGYREGYIKNLLVISNDVILHFDVGNKRILPHSYKGTYYYWEIDSTCKRMCYV